MTRLNFTGRRRIPKSNIGLRVRTANGAPVLDVLRLDLDQLRLTDDADIVIEAYRQTSYMRFGAGTVGAPSLPTGRLLHEFEAPDAVRFRVKVVGAGDDEGKILAAADQLRASLEGDDEEPQTSLLTIVPEDLGHVLWRLDFADEEPKLEVNKRVGDWRGFALQPTFTAFVLPEALRQIATWTLRNLELFEEGDGTPIAGWVAYLSELGHDPRDVSDAEDQELWVEDVVGHFGREHRFLNLVGALTGEVDE